MRILVDAHVFDGKYQGTRTYLQGLYSELIKYKDIQYYFAARNCHHLQTIFGTAPNVHYIQLKSTNSIVRLSVEYPQIIRRLNIDYAHFQYISPLIKTCKEIVTIHDVLFLDYPQYFPKTYRLKNNLLFKRSAKRADILLTVSNYSKEAISRHYHIPTEKIHITPNGILLPDKNIILPDTNKIYNLEKYILSVSRIEPRKNYLLLLKAYNELKLYEQGYKLVIIGTKDLNYKEFEQYYRELPNIVQQNILVTSVDYLELISLYKNANLFIFPSFAEGFGIPPLEAIALKCPTLCSNTTAMKEFHFLKDNLFSPHDIEELKTKIEINLKEKNVKQIESLQKEVINKYDWQKSANALYSLLKQDKQ